MSAAEAELDEKVVDIIARSLVAAIKQDNPPPTTSPHASDTHEPTRTIKGLTILHVVPKLR
jgi:hypothetical protein